MIKAQKAAQQVDHVEVAPTQDNQDERTGMGQWQALAVFAG